MRDSSWITWRTGAWRRRFFFAGPEGPRLQALTRRLPSEETRIRRGALARIEALTAEVTVPNVTEHAANLRRVANALESAEDKARELFAAAYENEERKEKNHA